MRASDIPPQVWKLFLFDQKFYCIRRMILYNKFEMKNNSSQDQKLSNILWEEKYCRKCMIRWRVSFNVIQNLLSVLDWKTFYLQIGLAPCKAECVVWQNTIGRSGINFDQGQHAKIPWGLQRSKFDSSSMRTCVFCKKAAQPTNASLYIFLYLREVFMVQTVS